MEIEVGIRELRERHLARDREGPAGEVTIETLEMEDVAREGHPGMEAAQRRQRRVRKTRHVDGDVARAAQDRFRDRPVDAHIEGEIAIELHDARQKLAEEIH